MTVTRDTIEGYFKRRYGDIERAQPGFAILQKRIPFESAKKTGENYNFPVILTRSHGVTFNGSTPGTAFSLKEAVSLVSKNAQVQGSEMVLREKIAYGTLSAAQSAGEAAFGSAMSEIVMGMKEAAAFYLEMQLLYGQTNIGIIQGSSDDSGTSQTYQLTEASWAPGLWQQMENAYVDVWAADWSAQRTTSDAQVTAVDPSNRLITLTGTEAQLDNIIATDIIVPRGHTSATTPTFEVMAGLDKIMTNTGTLFSISASTYSLWKTSSYAVGSAAATMGKIQAAVTQAVVRGLTGDVTVLVSVATWTDLMNDMASLRRWTSDTKNEMAMGSNSIAFYGSNGGKLEVLAHPMMKFGEFKVLPLDRVKRIGSSDITFKIPGATGQNDNMYTDLADAAGCQLRCYCDQAIILTTPARAVNATGVVNASAPTVTEYTTFP